MVPRASLPLCTFNHVSRVCRDLEASFRFYSEVLGFTPVKRPSSFEFEGAWLFNYGMGLHLIKGSPPTLSSTIEPKSCHISFQAANLEDVERCLQSWDLPYIKQVFVEDGIQVGQMFFHDPDHNMIEICNCDELPVVPLTEGILACAAKPLAAAAKPLLAHAPPPPPTPSPPRSDAGSDESLMCACETASEAASEAAAAATAGGRPACADDNHHDMPARAASCASSDSCSSDAGDAYAEADAEAGASLAAAGAGPAHGRFAGLPGRRRLGLGAQGLRRSLSLSSSSGLSSAMSSAWESVSLTGTQQLLQQQQLERCGCCEELAEDRARASGITDLGEWTAAAAARWRQQQAGGGAGPQQQRRGSAFLQQAGLKEHAAMVGVMAVASGGAL